MSSRCSLLIILITFFLPACLHAQSESELAEFQKYFDSGKTRPTPEQSLKVATLALDQAREIADGRDIAQALKHLGLIHLNQLHDYGGAMDFFIQALNIEDSLQLTSQQVLTYVAIARIFEVVGDFHKSVQFLTQALALNASARAINAEAMLRTNLGKVYASMGRTAEALEQYQKVLQYRQDIDRTYEADALFHLAHLYTQQGKYAEALDHHKRALALIRASGDRYAEAISLNDIGLLYGLMKNHEKSFANHEVALNIRQSLKDRQGIAESLNNIGAWYLERGDPGEALAHGTLALENGREAQAQQEMFRSYELLSQSYKALGDFRNALTNKERSLALHEFIENEAHERELLETESRYLLGKREMEIERLDALRVDREREIAAQKKVRNILFVLVGLIVVIALLIFYFYLAKRRSNRILEVAKNKVQEQNLRLQELNQTKDKFFSIISHDLKGPLNSLTSFSHLLIEHTAHMTPDEIKALALDLDKSLRNLFTLLENLLAWARSQTGSIDFSPEVFDLSEILVSNSQLLESQARNKDISIAVAAPEECRVNLHRDSINTVVRNLLSNAIKFTPQGGKIGARLVVGSGRVTVSISDTGVGMEPSVVQKLFRIDTKHSTKGTANEKGTGLGLILCREFVEKNGGTITVHSRPGEGSVFDISFDQACMAASAKIEPASFS